MNRDRHGGLLRHSILLMAATQVGNVCNVLFHVVMGRRLVPAQYGELAAMLGIVLILATPLDALRTAMAHFAARLVEEGRISAVPHLVRRWLGYMAWPAAAIFAAGILFCAPLAEFFHLYSRWLVVVTGAVAGGSLLLPIFIGALLGVQAFVWMSLCQHSWSVTRFLLGSLFVLLIPSALSGISAQALAVCVSAALGVWGLRAVVRSPAPAEEHVSGVRKYFVQSLLVLGSFAVLMNSDVVLVKHFFDPAQAGLFARAGTIGRTVIFLPMPIAWALFPKVTSAGPVGASGRSNLVWALAFTVLLIVVEVLVCSRFPWLPLWIMFGDRTPTPEMAQLVRSVTWAMAPLGLSYLLMNFEMAQHRFGSASWLILWATAYVLGVTLFHETVWQVVAVLASVSTITTVALILGLPWKALGEGGGAATQATA